MNRGDFIDMLEERVQLTRQMVGEVYELIDIFPYFQSAHLLLLKGLQSNGDIKFERQLRTSAVYIADREVLYCLLKNGKKPQEVQAAEASAKERPAEPVTSADSPFANQQTVIESARNSEQLINEIEHGSGQQQNENKEDSHPHGHSILIPSDAGITEPAAVMLLMDEETAPEEEKVFYMDPGFSVPDYSDLLELETDQDEPGQIEGAASAEIEREASAQGATRNRQAELIDKFILANPRIEPIREPPKLPAEDLSAIPSDKTRGFVTETLARIYINQGYYSKAIDIYTELSLKFPEKSSYFASQIEIVKEYLKK